MENEKKLISIIIPARNEYDNILELKNILPAIASEIKSCDFEFLLIDNHSDDDTESLIPKLHEKDDRWNYIRFSRNFGLESSLAAGLRYAKGDAVIVLYSDLQDPPELIKDMIVKWEEGYDIVYCKTVKRKDDSIIDKYGAIFLHKIIEKLSDIDYPEFTADFQLLSRPVVNAFNLLGERNRFFRVLVHWLGFKKYEMPYQRNIRKHGKPKNSFIVRLNVALTGIIAFSIKPLQVSGLVGIFFTVLSLVGFAFYFLLRVLSLFDVVVVAIPPFGMTTVILLVLLFGGINSLFLGIIGAYIANIYTEVKNRPLWLIEKSIGIDPK